MRTAIGNAIADLHVSCPARVESYDATTQKASVKPLLKARVTDETEERVALSRPVITNVPVAFPGGGGFHCTFPLAAGDTVLLVFSDQSLDKWLSAGGEVDPGDEAIHAPSDAFCIPCVRPFNNPRASASSSDMVMGADTAAARQIKITSSNIQLGGSANFVALATAAFATWLDTHTHPSNGAPPSTPSPSIAAANVKAT